MVGREVPLTRPVAIALIVAFVLRALFALVYWTDKPLTHDEREYLALGINLAAGRGFTPELAGAPSDPSVQQFGRAPLYPLILAGIALLGGIDDSLPRDVPAAVKLTQALVGVVAVWLVAAIARRAAGERAAILAAWLAACYPPLVWIAAYALSEAMYSALALATVWVLGMVTDARSPDREDRRAGSTAIQTVLLSGVLAGLAALTRPSMLFFAPFAVGLLMRRAPTPRTGLVRAAAFCLAMAAAITPWTLRNVVAYDRFVLIASEGGVTFWTGNHREARGEGDLAANPHLKIRNQEFRARHVGLSEEALEPLYYREALGFIAEDPARFAGLVARKLWFTIVPVGPSYRLHSPRYFWASVIPYALVLPLAILGWRRLAPDHRPRALVALAASAGLVCLVFFPQERFRIPVIDPTLVVLAGCGLALGVRPRRGTR